MVPAGSGGTSSRMRKSGIQDGVALGDMKEDTARLIRELKPRMVPTGSGDTESRMRKSGDPL